MLLLRPASRRRAPVLRCVEAPLGESTVLWATAGARTHRFAGALVLGVRGLGRGWGQ